MHRNIERELTLARRSIEECKSMGADVSAAEGLLIKASTMLAAENVEAADGLVKDLTTAIEKAKERRVNELLDGARSIIEEERSLGLSMDDCARLIEQAEEAYVVADFWKAIDLVNEAMNIMGESLQRQQMAQDNIVQARDLLEESVLHAVDASEAKSLLEESGEMATQGRYDESLAASNQAIIVLEKGLIPHIELILEETFMEVMKADKARLPVDDAKEALKQARRFHRRTMSAKALELAMKAKSIVREEQGHGWRK